MWRDDAYLLDILIAARHAREFESDLTQEDFLVLETKGQETQQDKTKREFLDEWVKAVNEHGGFGKWQ